MSTESHTIPDDMAARVARLINEAEDMRQQAADDLKQIYADLREELRGLGWDGKHVSAEVAALKGAIGEMRLDEKAKEKREEKGERVDDYVSLLTRARAREGNGYAAARRSDGGLSILTKHEDIRTAPVTAEESRANPVEEGEHGGCDEAVPTVEAGSRAAEERERQHALTVGFADDCRTGGKEQSDASAAPVGDAAAYAHGIPAISPDQPGEGGADEVTSSAPGAGDEAQTSNTGEGAANTALPANGVTMEYCPPVGVRRSSFAHCFPEPSKDQRAALERDIIDNRVQVPIIRQGNVILDGWARYTIARSLGQSYPVKAYDGDDELLDVIEWQRASRNFTQAQEKKIAADLAKAMPDRADDIVAAFGLAEALEAAE